MPRADETSLLSKIVSNFKPVFLYSKQTNKKRRETLHREQYTILLLECIL